MEEKLKGLTQANSEANRVQVALNCRNRGVKVIGILGSGVPEEVIYAAGMLPYRLSGYWKGVASRAGQYRNERSCRYCSHVLESLLMGELDFVDGVVAANDEDLVRLLDVWTYLRAPRFTHVVHVPHQNSRLACMQLEMEIVRFKRALEGYSGVRITDESLLAAMNVFNETRGLLMKMYELRKREAPPLSGAETLGITTAAMIMPKDRFNKDMESLLPYLAGRTTSLKHLHPRLLVSSDMLDNPAYLELAENASCIVAMDDLDTGSRYFWGTRQASGQDPIVALAENYTSQPGGPRMCDWERQVNQIIDWVWEFRIDGVLELTQAYSYARLFRVPFLRDRLKAVGIPSISLRREYRLADTGQLRTRIEAFLETLDSQHGTAQP